MTALLQAKSGWVLYLRWIFANALGEMIGLGLTFAVGIGLALLIGEPQGVGVAIGVGLLMVASGAIEGVVVGNAQWWAMQESFPEISRKEWVAATLIGALVAWTFASIPTTMMSMSSNPSTTPSVEPEQSGALLLAGLMGALLGIVLALVQWVVLRKVVRHSWWWLPANGIAWLVGMPIVFVAVDVAQNAATQARALLIFVGALALTGTIVGAIHGSVLVKLVSREIR